MTTLEPFTADDIWADLFPGGSGGGLRAPQPELTELDFTGGYMSTVHQPRKLKNLAKQYIADRDFDTLVGTGLSGTIATADVARYLKKNYLIVRKANDGSHSSLPVEGKLGKKWIFLDDLMGTGRTFCRVWDAVHKIAGDRNFKTEYQGMFLYNDETFYEVNDRYNSTHRWLTNHSQRYNGEYFSEAADRRYNGRYDW